MLEYVSILSDGWLIIASLVNWVLAIAIMIYCNGDWNDFVMYFIWNIAICIGLLFFIIPGLIILAIFLWRYGLINIVAVILGPVGWAIGSILGWLD